MIQLNWKSLQDRQPEIQYLRQLKLHHLQEEHFNAWPTKKVKNYTCIPCELGAINAAGNDATGSDTSCDPILCGANEKVSSNTCTSCEIGSVNNAGDDACSCDSNSDSGLSFSCPTPVDLSVLQRDTF